MNVITESYVLSLAPDITLSAAAVERLLAWASLHGYDPTITAAWRLPLTEGMVNAINHGCTGQKSATIEVRARLDQSGIEFSIRDPGQFAPGPDWSLLPEDPLSESGRGGYLIAHATDEWRHDNDATGHSLTLRWRALPGQTGNVVTAAQTSVVLENLTNELANAYEITSSYAHFVGLLVTAHDFTNLLHGVRARLTAVVPHAHFILRFISQDRLSLAPGSLPGTFPDSILLTSSSLEAQVASRGRFVTVGSPHQLALNDPLAPAASSLVVLPVAFAKKILGTLAVTVPPGGMLFTAGQIELLQSVADFIGIAYATDQLNRSRVNELRLQQDIVIAAGIQRMLLPQSMPHLPAWSLSGDCLPAREVGGDYFDFIPRADNSCLVVVADVMGKGIPAALVATMLRTALRARATHRDTPGELLTLLNHQLAPDLAVLEVFITAVLIVLPAAGGTLQYANAGHCPPLLFTPQNDSSIELGGGDMPLGVMANAVVADHTAEIPVESTLFMYTDGCFEWRRNNGSFLGSARFADSLVEHAKHSAPHLAKRILAEITTQAGPAGLPDDCTLVTLRRLS